MAQDRQYGERVNVVKYVRVENKWRLVAVVEKNGRIIRDQVWIAGRQEHHPEGNYFLEWHEQGRRRRQSVGAYDNIADAARRKALELSAQKAGLIPTPPAPVKAPAKIKIGAALDSYLEFVERHRSPRTYLTYRYTLGTLLRGSFTKTYVDDVGREDILKFIADCYARNLSGHTVYDKLVVVLQFFKRCGKAKLIEPSDWPSFVETIRPIYEAEEIAALIRHGEKDEAIFIKFLLASGFRDGEVRHVTWRDVDLRNSVVRVTAKPLWRFNPKNWEERVVPLPSALIEQLGALKERRDALPAHLVFPNTRGRPDSANDLIIKRVAHRAKLNCGQCLTRHGNRCAEGPYCQHFFLHKFRHTFATEHLRHGIDIRTLQTWMGHRDIQSTMVYLKGVQSKDALAKVNAGSVAHYVSLNSDPDRARLDTHG